MNFLMSVAGKRIFIVEDNAGNGTIMKILLQAAGAKVFVDRFAINTLQRIHEAENIDIILMDLMLPNGVTGYDIYDQLQTNPEFAHIPVVVVSASDPAIEMNKARAKGFRGYIPKPINNQHFAKMIGAILEGHTVWGEEFNEYDYH
ncbi:MAG: response regulator [Anaerolineae bacterium]|nr:response regulator [Anaerolineae bacterium]